MMHSADSPENHTQNNAASRVVACYKIRRDKNMQFLKKCSSGLPEQSRQLPYCSHNSRNINTEFAYSKESQNPHSA